MSRKDLTNNQKIVQDDILRYKKNKFAAMLALLALVFNCLYFMLFYSVNQNTLYTMLIGGSVILNLLVLLMGFFASEGIKGYNKKFSYLLLGLGVVQFVRIFIYPTIGMANGWLEGNFYFEIPMSSAANGTFFIIYLALSSACFIGSAVHGYIVASRLEAFQAKIDSGEINIDETLKEMEENGGAPSAEESGAAASVAETAVVAEEPVVTEVSEEKTEAEGEGENG